MYEVELKMEAARRKLELEERRIHWDKRKLNLEIEIAKADAEEKALALIDDEQQLSDCERDDDYVHCL